MNNKKIRWAVYFIVAGCLIGIALEYSGMKRNYREYVSYETQVETGLLSRLAQEYLERNDQKGFESFCLQVRRLRTDENISGENIEESKSPSIFDVPKQVGLQSRVTLFDVEGKVLFDSWKDAGMMENHAGRPEFQAVHPASSDSDAFSVYKRYSTTIQKEMFFCITKFEANNKVYLLRTGNTVQAVQNAGSGLFHNFFIITFLFIVVVSALFYLFFSKYSLFKRQLLEISRKYTGKKSDGISTGISETVLLEPGIDRTLEAIKDEFDHNRELLSREKNLRDIIFQTLTEGIVLLNDNGHVLDINESACRLLEISQDKVLGCYFFSVWRNVHLEKMFKEKQWTRQGNRLVWEELTLDLPVESKTIDVRLGDICWDSTSKGCLLLLYDLTRIKRLENYRRDFVANVSHEIKTPLTVMMGAVEALQDGAINNPAEADNFLNILIQHSKRLFALVQDVLTLSNLESRSNQRSEQYERQSLTDTIEMAISYCEPDAEEKKIHLVLENNAADDKVTINANLMEQALVNLIANAVKYTTDGKAEKKVTIRMSNPDTESILVEVMDEGPGIPCVHQNRIFERFYRVDQSRNAQTGGTGLGLAIVKHIIQLHQGTVSLKNIKDNTNTVTGCNFFFQLPLGEKVSK